MSRSKGSKNKKKKGNAIMKVDTNITLDERKHVVEKDNHVMDANELMGTIEGMCYSEQYLIYCLLKETLSCD